MNDPGFFAGTPLSVLFVLTIGFVIVAIGGGFWLGGRLRSRQGGTESIGSAVGATLGLLAFMLGFAFSMAANRLDARKQLFLEEVNAIETASLRAGLLVEPYTARIRGLLREYVDVRVDAMADADKLAAGMARSGEIHAALWRLVEQKVAEAPPTITDSLFIQSLNEVIDLHSERVVVGMQYRIPATIWVGLYTVAALAMLMVGMQFGLTDQRQPLVVFALSLTFSAVIILIMDLDRAGSGTIRVDQQPLLELQQRLHAPGPSP